MKIYCNKWYLFIFIFLSLFTAVALFAYSYINDRKLKIDDLQVTLADINNSEEFYDNFRIKNISAVRRDGNKVIFSLTADTVIHRKRISKLFVYQNLKEIYMSDIGLNIYFDQYPDNVFQLVYDSLKTLIFLNKSEDSSVVDDTYSRGISYEPHESPEHNDWDGRDIDLDFLTRILFDNVTVVIYLPRNEKVSLSFTNARMNSDFENIVLEGLKVISYRGQELCACQGVLTKRYIGIYLPEGYTLGNNYFKEKAFFAITSKGELVKNDRLPEIEYADKIEEYEEVLYSNLTKKIPKHVRIMLGFPEDVF
jgi:hypothetical protein